MSYRTKQNFGRRTYRTYPARYSKRSSREDLYYGLPHLSEHLKDDPLGNFLLLICAAVWIFGAFILFNWINYATMEILGTDLISEVTALFLFDVPTLLHWYHNEWADYSAELPSVELIVLDETTHSSQGQSARR